MKIDLRISGIMYEQLFQHLFSGDGKESIAIALCGKLKCKDSLKLLVHSITVIPEGDCLERTETKLKWSTDKLIPLLEIALQKGLSVLKIHSHPTGYPKFSETDDFSDKELFKSVCGWMDNDEFHASAVMLPDGKIFGRVLNSSLEFIPIDKVLIAGDDLKYYHFSERQHNHEEFALRTVQAFGEGTNRLLRNMSVAVVGCSGTGSPVIEQLVRLGIGKIVLVDPDIIENKNLNRILNSTSEDAKEKKFKVNVLKEAIVSIGIGTQVDTYNKNIFDDVEIIKAIAECDIIFGCLDSIDGRHLLNQIANFYLVPYFDLGVKLIADGKGGIDQIWTSIHYLQPGGSSLLTRGLYSHEDLSAASLFRVDPIKYEALKKEGYIRNINVESPAVISINMQVASMAIIEFLARIHNFRYDSNKESAIIRMSLGDGYIQKETDGEADKYLQKFVGRGDMKPLLNMPEFNASLI